MDYCNYAMIKMIKAIGKKQYDVYKRITRNATGLGFNESGEIAITSYWWNELIKGCLEASKLRTHLLKDIPLLDRLYARVTVSVNEGWQPRDGPSKLRDAPNPLTKKPNQLNRLENLDHVEREKLWPLANK
ncbi:hypothetical protein F2Q70_00030822 [Brassica cretica]|uniref:Uncharacterized protein n=1 Tax=Brassica cretica TaxID=69181 RepID=A0A8S9FHT3_BRACR|nr:hypothetical protein F2Q70_00030822 [Brassica cretica]KAF3489506.1 hypothetical protein F2Q69_00054336 [Brassica cretica]